MQHRTIQPPWTSGNPSDHRCEDRHSHAGSRADTCGILRTRALRPAGPRSPSTPTAMPRWPARRSRRTRSASRPRLPISATRKSASPDGRSWRRCGWPGSSPSSRPALPILTRPPQPRYMTSLAAAPGVSDGASPPGPRPAGPPKPDAGGDCPSTTRPPTEAASGPERAMPASSAVRRRRIPVEVEAADKRRVRHAELAQHPLEGPAEPGEAFGVVIRLQHQLDRAVGPERHPAAGEGKILAGQPEVDRVLRDLAIRGRRSPAGGARCRALDLPVIGLAEHLDVPIGYSQCALGP